MNIPKGYKLVPTEPTREMCLAAKHEQATYPLSFDANSPVVTYRAMLAAAPTPPQTIYDEENEREIFEIWADEKGFCLDCEFFKNGNNYIDLATGWLYEAWLACAQSRAKAGEVGNE